MVKTEVAGTRESECYRIAADVRVVSTGDLPDDVRARLAQGDARFALVRQGARTGPLLVDAEMAALLEEFNRPSGIVEALVRFSTHRRRDPHEVLREAFPTLRLLVERGYLVDAAVPAHEVAAAAALGVGDRLGNLVVVRPLQRMEDTEVFQARSADQRFAAVKIERRGGSPAARGLAHEATVLEFLAGDPAPRLLAVGEDEGRRFLVLEWCTGSAAQVVADCARRTGGGGVRERRRRICCRILEAYGRLHRRGVVHGDVNGRNVLVDRDDRVTLLDFEAAAPTNAAGGIAVPRGRAGVPIFLEPELAIAEIDRRPPPPATTVGEQYSLAALVYQIITGLPYLDFDLRRERLLEQIVDAQPAPFSDRGVAPWPAVEAVLGRALSKDPADRYGSVDAMAEALATAEPPGKASRVGTVAVCTGLDDLLDRTIEQAAPGGAWTANAMEADFGRSVYRGAAGVAVALYRLSRARGLQALLDDADRWSRRAIDGIDRTVGVRGDRDASALVGAAGVHLVEAVIASALGESRRETLALRRVRQCIDIEPNGMDLFDGRSGRLLSTAILLDRARDHAAIDRGEIEKLGRQTVDDLWSDLEERPRIAETVGDLGMAHGWAGHLYATLRWCRSVGDPVPGQLERRLCELADQSVPVGRGLMWPWRLPLGGPKRPQFTAGWCNGSGGFVFLWTAAAEVLESDRWIGLARGAAWNSWESAQRESSLCCGLVGRAYAMLRLYRATGEQEWIGRARDLAETAARAGRFDHDRPWGLFRGPLGLAVLAADLRHPDGTWFPFMDDEPGTERPGEEGR